MTMTLIADAPVDVDAEGFLTDPAQWNEQIAEAIAAQNGIPELTKRHWLVVRFMRDRYLQTGTAPSAALTASENTPGSGSPQSIQLRPPSVLRRTPASRSPA